MAASDSPMGISDRVTVEVNGKPTVKGPDPDVWGEDHCAPSIEAHEVGQPGVKGPDPRQWTGDMSPGGHTADNPPPLPE